jgi:hypothetical protein
VEQVSVLQVDEAVWVNRDQLAQLYTQLGDANAENVVCRAMEELAIRLAHTEKLYRENKHEDMRKCARSMTAIAEQIGLGTLARVAKEVVSCIDDTDANAIAATFARLLRIGEQSLMEIWDIQDLSV